MTIQVPWELAPTTYLSKSLPTLSHCSLCAVHTGFSTSQTLRTQSYLRTFALVVPSATLSLDLPSPGTFTLFKCHLRCYSQVKPFLMIYFKIAPISLFHTTLVYCLLETYHHLELIWPFIYLLFCHLFSFRLCGI